MLPSHEIVERAHGASEMLDRLLMGHVLEADLQGIDLAWCDEPLRVAPAINVGASTIDDDPPIDHREPQDEDRGEGDPTYRAAVTPNQARALRRRVAKRVLQIESAVNDLVTIHEALKPKTKDQLEALRSARDDELKDDSDGWCKSCRRIKVESVVTLAPDGEPYYVGMCRSCGQLRAQIKADYPIEMRMRQFPPKQLVLWKHLGRRIYDSHIRAALGIDQVSDEGRKRAERMREELRSVAS